MPQIYSTYIRLNKDLIDYLISVKYDKEIYPNLERGQLKTLEGTNIRLSLIHFHILIALTRKQNHSLSQLTDEFFESLSKYKDKLTIRFDFKNNDITPLGVEYLCQSNKTNILLKKRIIKSFSDADLPIREVKRKTEYPITQFIFE